MLTVLQSEDDNKRLDVIRRRWSVKLIHPWSKSVTWKGRGYRRTNLDADKGKDYIDSRGLQSY